MWVVKELRNLHSTLLINRKLKTDGTFGNQIIQKALSKNYLSIVIKKPTNKNKL